MPRYRLPNNRLTISVDGVLIRADQDGTFNADTGSRFEDVLRREGAQSQPSAGPRLTFRKAGNLNSGAGADTSGVLGTFKLNLGSDILIPRNILVPGESTIRMKATVRRTGADASFLDLRFGTTNGTSDPTTNVAVQFDASQNPQDIIIDVFMSITAGRITCAAYLTRIGGSGTYCVTGEVAGLNFGVDNFINFIVSAGTTGLYRIVSYEVEVFQ